MSKFSENLDNLDFAIARFYEDSSMLIGERRLVDTLAMVYTLIRNDYTRWHSSENG